MRFALVVAPALVYPREVFHDPDTWPRARRLDAVALALVGNDSTTPGGAERSASYLLDQLASYRHGALGAHGSVRRLFERALAIDEKVLGPHHRSIAASPSRPPLRGLLRMRNVLDTINNFPHAQSL